MLNVQYNIGTSLEMHSPSKHLLWQNIYVPLMHTLRIHCCHLDKPHKSSDGPDTSKIEGVHCLPHLECMHANVANGIIHVISEHAFQDLH